MQLRPGGLRLVIALCCARAASGQATAEPITLMNSRRPLAAPEA